MNPYPHMPAPAGEYLALVLDADLRLLAIAERLRQHWSAHAPLGAACTRAMREELVSGNVARLATLPAAPAKERLPRMAESSGRESRSWASPGNTVAVNGTYGPRPERVPGL